MMKVILKETIDSLGIIGSEVSVANGYARNFLLPQDKAVHATRRTAKSSDSRKPNSIFRLPRKEASPKKWPRNWKGIVHHCCKSQRRGAPLRVDHRPGYHDGPFQTGNFGRKADGHAQGTDQGAGHLQSADSGIHGSRTRNYRGNRPRVNTACRLPEDAPPIGAFFNRPYMRAANRQRLTETPEFLTHGPVALMAETRSQKPKDPSLYHIPPQNIEAEDSLLSAILVDNDTLLDVVEILSPDDFYRSAHQKIYAAILDLFSRNEPVDLVTLSNILREQHRLEAVGGALYLAKLLDTVPMAVNAAHHAKIVHDKAVLRRLIEKSNGIVKRCYEDSGDVDDVMDYAESTIFELSQDKVRPAFYPIGKIIEDNIETLEDRQENKSLITGTPTGFRKLDSLTAGFQNSDLIIIAARPGMGKTALALNIARNMAVDANVPTAVFSLEMAKEQLSMRLLCSEARIDSNRVRSGFFSQDDWVKLTDAAMPCPKRRFLSMIRRMSPP